MHIFPDSLRKALLLCAFENKIGGKVVSFPILAKGIIPAWLDHTTTSSGGAEKECLLPWVATAFIKSGMERLKVLLCFLLSIWQLNVVPWK